MLAHLHGARSRAGELLGLLLAPSVQLARKHPQHHCDSDEDNANDVVTQQIDYSEAGEPSCEKPDHECPRTYRRVRRLPPRDRVVRIGHGLCEGYERLGRWRPQIANVSTAPPSTTARTVFIG